ncbi:PAS domain-containing protein, partial [Coleofasciculus sp. LEGE 07081]
MTLLIFILGLALGIGFCWWQQRQRQRQLKRMLELLPAESTDNSFPLVSQLRSAIAILIGDRAEIKEKLNTTRQVLQVAPVGYLQVDEDNRLIWCNEQARQLLQLDRWQPGQKRLLLELVRSYELDQLIERTREQQQPAIQEWVFHPACIDGAAMGEVRSLTLRASSLPLSHGQVSVFLENRQPLVELSQSRNQWVSDLAHELRTPLTSIRLVAETLQGRVKPPESRWIEQLLQETNRLIELVQNWLELSHLEKNPSKSLTYQSVELRSLIESAWQRLEPLAQQKQLSLAYQGPDTLSARGDKSRLIQVFLNLLDNSIKHSPPQALIQVKVTPTQKAGIDSDALVEEESFIQIDIIDSGSGFSASDLPHVFERLYRGDVSRYRAPVSGGSSALGRSSGSGLGLSIVQEIVQAHSGTVRARNHPETGGAWLQIQLPHPTAVSS